MSLALALANSDCGAGWSPLQMSNISGWWDAAPLHAGALSTWNDSSPNANNLAHVISSPTVVANQQNGLPGVQFNGTSNQMKVAFTLTFPATVFVAFKMAQPGAANHDIVFDGFNAAGLTMCLANDNTPEYYMYAGALMPSTPIAGTLAASGVVATCQYNDPNSKLWTGTSNVATGSTGENRGSPNGFCLGGQSGLSRLVAATFFEIMVINGASSAADITLAQTYLKNKWAL